MSDLNEFNHELARTPTYLVLSRRHGTTLFAQLLANRQQIDRLERRRDDLAEQLEAERNLVILALHDLALERKEKEPHHFIRRWLSSHRVASADANKEARLLG